MNALQLLLAGLPRGADAGEVAAVLTRLVMATGPRRASLTVQFVDGQIRVRVVATPTQLAPSYAEPREYISDLAALDDVADRWGHGASSSGRVVWWAQLGTADLIGA